MKINGGYIAIKLVHKLLPTFLAKLAMLFIKIIIILILLKKFEEQGDISEDGELWVDKYTGYTITNIDFNSDSEYTQDGYKLITSDIMEKDIGDSLFTESNSKIKYTDPISGKFFNIIKSISDQCGIDISNHIESVIETQPNHYLLLKLNLNMIWKLKKKKKG